MIEEEPGGERLSANQRYHLIAADIAMAAAIKTFDPNYAIASCAYAPGSLRDAWLAQCADEGLKRRVSSMASAGVNALKVLPADKLAAAAANYGIVLPDGASERMADHFEAKRNAVLSYNR